MRVWDTQLSDRGIAGEATPHLLDKRIGSLNQLALHHPLFALLLTDLTQLGAGHQ